MGRSAFDKEENQQALYQLEANGRENIFLFIPNLIDYARIVIVLISFYFMPFNHILASIFYLTSVLLDEFDGWAARHFNQETRFGAVLDMVIDRCATTCLIMCLCLFYPTWLFLWQLLVALDIASHLIMMYSSAIHMEASHKGISTANIILRLYYSEPALSIACYGNELFFTSIYLMYFTPGFIVNLFGFKVGTLYILAVVTAPIFFLKQVASVVQLVVACRNLGALDGCKKKE